MQAEFTRQVAQNAVEIHDLRRALQTVCEKRASQRLAKAPSTDSCAELNSSTMVGSPVSAGSLFDIVRHSDEHLWQVDRVRRRSRHRN